MSLDRSLKVGGSLARHRNVLTRAERIAKLVEKEKFNWATGSPTGLVKVANRKVSAGGKAAAKKDAAATPAAGAAAPAPAAGAKAAAAPAAKGAGKGDAKKK